MTKNRQPIKKKLRLISLLVYSLAILIVLAIVEEFGQLPTEVLEVWENLKSLLQIFASPIVLVFVAKSINQEFEKRKQEQDEERESLRYKDIQENRRKETFRQYLQQMTELLTADKFANTKDNDPVAIAAKALTVTAIRELDNSRIEQVSSFLTNTGLAGMRWKSSSILREADLSGIDLSNVKLSGINLEGADLSNVNLSDTHLENINLKDANLSGADLSGAYLKDVNLSNVNFKNAKLNCAKFQKIIYTETTKFPENFDVVTQEMYLIAPGSDLSHADLSGIDLNSIDFSNTNLSYANLRNTNLERANLSGANLSHVDLINTNLKRANLMDAILFNANLEGADFSNANLQNVNLSAAYLVDVDLTDAKLQSANLNEANLSNATLIGADLSSVCLASANLKEANLMDAILSNANLLLADFSNANLEIADLEGADFSHANFSYANLRNAYLKDTKNKTNSQIKLACFWQKAIYKGNKDERQKKSVVDSEANQRYIYQLKKDESSDPKYEVNCTNWK